jgi:hypothetical protein
VGVPNIGVVDFNANIGHIVVRHFDADQVQTAYGVSHIASVFYRWWQGPSNYQTAINHLANMYQFATSYVVQNTVVDGRARKIIDVRWADAEYLGAVFASNGAFRGETRKVRFVLGAAAAGTWVLLTAYPIL